MSHHRRCAVLIGTLAMVMVGCGGEPQAAAVQASADAIGAARDRFVTAVNADDLEGMMAVVPEDGVGMPPNAPSVSGVEAYRRWHQTRIDQFTTQMRLTRTNLRSADGWAVEWLTYDLTLTPRAGGAPTHDTGRVMWQWHRQADGSWKIRRAIWNSDQPLPAAD